LLYMYSNIQNLSFPQHILHIQAQLKSHAGVCFCQIEIECLTAGRSDVHGESGIDAINATFAC